MAISLIVKQDFTPLRGNDHATLLKKSLKKLPLQNVGFQPLATGVIKPFKRVSGFLA
ncbi:hypothetical protein G3V96_25380 [Escherichia coli]|nr:hypothetical protein [Escherichia coli]